MKIRRTQHPTFDGPRRPDEPQFTTLQLTRLALYLNNRLRRSRRLGLVTVLCVVAATTSYGVAEYQAEQRACHQRAEGRKALIELIAVAIGDVDGDGHSDRPGTDLADVEGTPQYLALDPDDQAMWRLFLSTRTSTRDLEAFAASLSPLDC